MRKFDTVIGVVSVIQWHNKKFSPGDPSSDASLRPWLSITALEHLTLHPAAPKQNAMANLIIEEQESRGTSSPGFGNSFGSYSVSLDTAVLGRIRFRVQGQSAPQHMSAINARLLATMVPD